MKNIKYLILLTILCGCINSNVERVRIIDNEGNPVKINKTVPKFNEEQINKQRNALKNAKNENIEINKFRQDFNNKSKNIRTDSNIIVPQSNRYPNDIFADRITNYNYIQDTKVKSTNSTNTIPTNKIIEENIVNESNITENSKFKKQNIIYTLEEKNNKQIENNKVTPKKTSTATSIKTTTNSAKNYYIQIGVYSEKKNADNAHSKYSKIGNTIIDENLVKNKKQYIVLIGPYSDKNLAEKDMEKVIKTGHYDVFITEKK